MNTRRYVWLNDDNYTDFLVDLFIKNVDETYISYGEIFCERAIDFNKWSPELKNVLRSEIKDIVTKKKTNSKIAIAFDDSKIVGFSIIAIENNSNISYAFLEDIVIDSEYRKLGVGKELTDFIEKELQDQGVKQVYLESGHKNHLAHKFFENRGYSLVAKVMCKTL